MEEVFTIDQTAYNTNSFIPQLTAEIIEVGSIRSQRMAEVWIYPVQFNPVTEQLQVFTDIEVTLSFTNPTTEVSVNTGIFSNICQNVMLNYTEGGIGASVNDRAQTPGTVSWATVNNTLGQITADYLIIAAPAFFNSQNADLLALAQHRANYNGFDVAIVNVAHVISDAVGYPYETEDELELYIDEQRIRNFLQSVYLNGTAHNTYDGKLGYVLLVGADGDHVSDDYKVVSGLHRSQNHLGVWSVKFPSDYYYSRVVPQGAINHGDFFIGRFSVNNETDLQNIVNKTIYFETEATFEDWKKNVLFSPGYENNNMDKFVSALQSNTTYIQSDYNITLPIPSQIGVEGVRQANINAFNEGSIWINYNGHGEIRYWQTFNYDDFNQLTNSSRQGVVISFACQTGWLDTLNYCMAEYFTNSPTGSVGFFGASRDMPSEQNGLWGFNKSLWQNLSTITGEFILEGRLLNHSSPLFNYFGDPALNLMAPGYLITQDIILSGEIELKTHVTIKDNATVHITEGTVFNFLNNSSLTIEQGSSLIIGDNVVITGNHPGNRIITSGHLEFEGNCTTEVGLIIQNGSIVELGNNNTLRIGETAPVIINPSSSLIVDGGTLTSSSGIWPGIRVNGNSLLPQTPLNQGTLILRNNARIENANIGIQVGYLFTFPGNQGGIVMASDAIFLNNQRDIVFDTYQSTNPQGLPIKNISFFDNCQFITDANTSFITHFEQVKLNNIYGITFNRCRFKDLRTELNYTTSITARKGILSQNSTFSIYNSSFEKLHYGVYATTTNPLNFFEIHNSEFSSYRGIYFNNTDRVIIKGNDFLVTPGNEYSPERCTHTYGLYVDNSSFFTIEDNNISSSSNNNSSCGSIGLIVRNTGHHTNQIYRNKFTGLLIGIEAIGKNKGSESYEGLEVKCNIFDENLYDIYITSGEMGHSKESGIREFQGYSNNHTSSTLAGNLFGNRSNSLVSNFINNAYPVYYFHHNSANNYRVKPDIYSGVLYLFETSIDFDFDLSCPVRITPTPYSELLSELQESTLHFEETKLLLEEHTDAGSTQNMSLHVQMANTTNAYSTYMHLIETSPYLSEGILIELSSKEEGFSKAMIRDILVGNPQAAKSDRVNEALDNRIDMLPAYMRWQINNGLNHLGEKELMQVFMSYQKSRQDQALNELLRRHITAEDEFENAQMLESLIAQNNDKRYQYLLSELKFAHRLFNDGLDMLLEMGQNFEFKTQEEIDSHQEKLEFFSLLSNWSSDSFPNFENLPLNVLQQIETYLYATPKVAGLALSILIHNSAIQFEEPILIPENEILPKSGLNKPYSSSFMTESLDIDFQFTIFPNPSRDYLTLNWCFDSMLNTHGSRIEIYNSSGMHILSLTPNTSCNQEIINLSAWKNGFYTASLKLPNGLFKTITFAVAK